MIEVNI